MYIIDIMIMYLFIISGLCGVAAVRVLEVYSYLFIFSLFFGSTSVFFGSKVIDFR